MSEPQLTLDAPIPGEGLTHKLGDRPWQKPAQYTTVDEVIPFYVEKIRNPDFTPQLLKVIKIGFPLTTIANSMQNAAVMEGIHSVDVGILALPPIVELLALVAKENDVPYKTGLERPEAPEEPSISEADIALAMKDMDEEEPEIEETVPVEEVKSEPTGLMARREM
tara:strand:+ start:407 stop:904 length:498 start_codon:yes stop_codon:yes gene_type:complete